MHGISVSRDLFRKDSSAKAVEIHGFADSSEQAYAGVVYLRVEYESGEVEVKMIASKSKVCPIQRQSIQRLELLDACLLAKLVHSVREILKDELGDMIVKTYYWVDSYSALFWIRNVKLWTPYVRHRVSQILQTSDRDEWHHCPGQINPADLPSRGKYQNLAASSLWWEGPAFLKLEAREWPKLSCGSEFEVDVAMKEQLKTQCKVTHTIFTAENRSQPRVDKIVDLDRFSNKGKLLRTVAWVLRFTSNLKAAIKKDDINREEMVTVSEIDQAELVLVQSIQAESFSKEIHYLSSEEPIKRNLKVPLYVSQFNLYLDENNILRCRSRLGKSSILDYSKRPILLPSKNRYSTLVIDDCHEKAFHNGNADT